MITTDSLKLQDIIDVAEYGNSIHISVLFLNNRVLNENLELEFKNIVHLNKFCNAVKTNSLNYKKCLKCKDLAVKKAVKTKKAFCGNCIHGVFEYCYPVVIENSCIAVIFIGNIEGDRNKHPISDEQILSTLQPFTDVEEYKKIAEMLNRYISANISFENVTNNTNRVSDKIKLYVNHYFTSDITLTALAIEFNYNAKYLGRLFFKETGMSFANYLNGKRLDYAKQLLQNRNLSVTEISSRCGYNNVTYFNNLFKKQYKVSPTKYRNHG